MKKAYMVYVLLACMFVWIALPLIPLATEHLRVVETFNTDEGEFLWSLHLCMERGDFALDRTEYGLLYYNIGLFTAKIFSLFGPVSDTLIIGIFRSLSALFVVATALVCARLSSFLTRSPSGLFAFGLCLLGSTVVLNYGTMLHPDTAQMFFLILALYFSVKALEYDSKMSLILAALAAGLAFSTKYAGIALAPIFFLIAMRLSTRTENHSRQAAIAESLLLCLLALPVIWIFDAEALYRSMGNPAQKSHELFLMFRLLRWGGIAAFAGGVFSLFLHRRGLAIWLRFVLLNLLVIYAFLFGFFSGSPQFINSRGFVEGFLYVTDLHRYGHWFADTGGASAWLMLFLGEGYGQRGVSVAILLLALISVLLFQVHKNDRHRLSMAIPWLWVMIFLFTLLSRVSSKFPHYLLPLWPAIVVLAAMGWQYLNNNSRRLGGILALSLIGVSSWNLWVYRLERQNSFESSEAMAAGRWMQENIRGPVSVLSDKYAYVPALEGWQYASLWQLTPEEISQRNPDVLVITEKIWSRFLGQNSQEYLNGLSVYNTRQSMYLSLLDNTYPGFVLMADFGGVKVFGREKQK